MGFAATLPGVQRRPRLVLCGWLVCFAAVVELIRQKCVPHIAGFAITLRLSTIGDKTPAPLGLDIAVLGRHGFLYPAA